MEFLNMSLDEMIKASKKEKTSNFNVSKLKRKPIRKFTFSHNQFNNNPKYDNQASSYRTDYKSKFIPLPPPPTKSLHHSESKKPISTVVHNHRRIKIKNLDPNIDNSELRELFEQCGKLKKLGIEWDDLGRSLGSAIVEYENEEDAKKAIKSYHGAELDGLVLDIDYEFKTLKKKI